MLFYLVGSQGERIVLFIGPYQAWSMLTPLNVFCKGPVCVQTHFIDIKLYRHFLLQDLSSLVDMTLACFPGGTVWRWRAVKAINWAICSACWSDSVASLPQGPRGDKGPRGDRVSWTVTSYFIKNLNIWLLCNYEAHLAQLLLLLM